MTDDNLPSGKLFYTRDDLAGFEAERDLGFPVQFPFTRGIQPTMYRGRLWTMRQYAGMGDAERATGATSSRWPTERRASGRLDCPPRSGSI
jgi:methylmalonyl-CoA mutase N-terminal domain/subunit